MIEAHIIDRLTQTKQLAFEWDRPGDEPTEQKQIKHERAIYLQAFGQPFDPNEEHIWLSPDQSLATLEQQLKPNIHQFKTIALWIPKFTDGRAYSLAFFIRRRLGYQNTLLAIGDVQPDQIIFLHRVGFDLFALKQAEKPSDSSMKNYFSEVYQCSFDQASTIFEKRLLKQGVKQHD